VGALFHYGVRNNNLLKRIFSISQTLNISTWHGTPIKKLYSDAYLLTSSKLLVMGNEYSASKLQNFTNNEIPIAMIGSPRNDILFKIDRDFILEVRQKLQLPLKKKILLFAPTFRNYVRDSGIAQVEMIDFDRLFTALASRFGGEWVFVYRVHHVTEKYLEKYSEFNDSILNGNRFEDMAEYLVACDILITDYSGSLFDFALTDKPAFIFAHDAESYLANPGLSMALDETPYKIAYDFEELIGNIERYDEVSAQAAKKSFNCKIGNREIGCASEWVANKIIDFLKRNKKN
jgi:CDP-glycerol glycerophosphotransferase